VTTISEELQCMTKDLQECNKQLREIFKMTKEIIADRDRIIEKLTAERDILKKRLNGKKK
jgi:hypothetical protein